ncbi:MAG: o-succinylbenzoate--CoA ligase [Frankiales bacterium]|nr:o-succinylbenzoate--CoA ligase [Frankiales bacterium]
MVQSTIPAGSPAQPGAELLDGAGVSELSFDAMTPTAFLDRSGYVFAERTAVIDGAQRFTYREFADRCRRLGGALAGLGVQPGDRVAVLSANGRVLLESHFGVPYAGAVLVSLNSRLSVAELTYIVEHSGARVVLHDDAMTELAREVCAGHPELLVRSASEVDELVEAASPLAVPVTDERGLIALNYTSGTTGRPKGVMYHHRGAYLQALAMTSHFHLTSEAVYLWTLPMFHCNGWCFTWAVTAAGGTHVLMPTPEPGRVWQLIDEVGVTHLCGAPTVLIMLASHKSAAAPDHPVVVAVGGGPPSPSLLARCAELNLDVTHLYGLTESFGPVVINDWRAEWNALDPVTQSVQRARQGVGNVISHRVRVINSDDKDVAPDGLELGEILLRGNNVMLGYYRDPEATAKATIDGWFRTGDLGVLHPDGYLQIRDRAKDIIISGGENISSVEIEVALASHPAVLEAAVVAMPHEHWGERPVACVVLRDGAAATEQELIEHVRERLARFKVPDRIIFGELPKTSTGKIQKFRLREQIMAALGGTDAAADRESVRRLTETAPGRTAGSE